jgi:hypothetical protein
MDEVRLKTAFSAMKPVERILAFKTDEIIAKAPTRTKSDGCSDMVGKTINR